MVPVPATVVHTACLMKRHLINMDNNEDEESSDANYVLFNHETFPSWWRTTTIPLNNTYRHLYNTGTQTTEAKKCIRVASSNTSVTSIPTCI